MNAVADLYVEVLDGTAQDVPYGTSGLGWELTYDAVTRDELNPTPVVSGHCYEPATCAAGTATCATGSPACQASDVAVCSSANVASCQGTTSSAPPWCAALEAPNCAEIAPTSGLRRIQVLVRGAGTYSIVAQVYPRTVASQPVPASAASALRPVSAWSDNSDQGP